MMSAKAIAAAAAIIAMTVSSQSFAAKHLCHGTLLEMRIIGLDIGDCDLNSLSRAELKRLTDVCGQPNDVEDRSNSTVCSFYANVKKQPGIGDLKQGAPWVVKKITSPIKVTP